MPDYGGQAGQGLLWPGFPRAEALGCSLGPFHGRSAICYLLFAKREDRQFALEPENREK
jgi:hypothetical protein